MKVHYPIMSGKTALLVIDMQNAFCEPTGAFYNEQTKPVKEKIKQLVSTAREKGLLIIYLRHVVRQMGNLSNRLKEMLPSVDQVLIDGSRPAAIVDDLAPREGELIVNKPHFGGFTGTDLDEILRANGIDTLIICGTVTNVCCDTTARQAVERQYKVIFLSDATAANDKPDLGWGPVKAEEFQRVTLTTLASVFCQISTTDEVIREMKTL